MTDVILVQHIIGDHIEALLAEQEDLKCKLWSFVSSFTGQTWMTGQTMMMLYKGHNRPRRSERPEVQSAGLVQEPAGLVQESAGLVQESAGLVQESAGLVQESAGLVQESAGLVQESAGLVQESAGLVQESAGLVQESAAERPEHNKHARLEHKLRAQRIQDVDQSSESADVPNGHSSRAGVQTTLKPMQHKIVACPAHWSRAQKAEAERSEEYSMESILADLCHGTTQHKLMPSRQADAGMQLSHFSLPGSWRSLQAEHEQHARDSYLHRQMVKLDGSHDLQAAPYA